MPRGHTGFQYEHLTQIGLKMTTFSVSVTLEQLYTSLSSLSKILAGPTVGC